MRTPPWPSRCIPEKDTEKFFLCPTEKTRFHLKAGREAFSLLELLVSVTLLGLVSALIYGAFFQVSNSSMSVKATLSLRQELRLLMKMVLDDLQAMQYLEHFVESKEKKDSGIIAETLSGPENSEVSRIDFHAAIPSRFFRDLKTVREGMDPRLHEIGYVLELDPSIEVWQFKRREDFYVDDNLREGGREQVLSESVQEFSVSFRTETKTAAGFLEEKFDNYLWDTVEKECFDPKNPPCLPDALQLSMSLKGENGQTVKDSQVINLCVRPCKPELFE